MTTVHRRTFLATAAVATLVRPQAKAKIAVTLDLEMLRHYPRRGMTEWDYRKGELDGATKRYALRFGERAAELGIPVHFFLVGRALEQRDVDWLLALRKMGHPIGNHTYDHVNILARRPEDIQYRFRRCPWLIEGKAVPDVLRENIRLTTRAMQLRLGTGPVGFRAPGGFSNGLKNRPDVQRMLLSLGFGWVSTLYPSHAYGPPGERPSKAVVQSILDAQANAQPFPYPTGLVEIPMSPISDVGAFRTQRWKLSWFIEVTEKIVQVAVERAYVFDFLGHPACLSVEDPRMELLEKFAEWARAAAGRVEFVTLDQLAAQGEVQEVPSENR